MNMDEDDIEELKDLAKKAKAHSHFVDQSELDAIDGIPGEIEKQASYGNDYYTKKEIEKLRNVANEHGDYELGRIADKMKRRL